MNEDRDLLPDPQVRLHSITDWIALFLAYLWSKKFVIVLLVVLGGIGGAMYNYYKDARYTAKLTFALDEEGGSSYANIAEQFGISLESGAGGAFKGENLLELFKSRYIIEKTLLSEKELNNKRDLVINFLLSIEFPNKFDNAKFVANQATNLYQDSVVNVLHEAILREMLDVSRIDKRLIYVNVSVSSKNAALSKMLVESLLDNVVLYYIDTKTRKAKKNVDVMHKELDSVKNLMTGAIYQSARGSDLNVNPLKQIVRAPIQRSTADAQVYIIAYGEIMKNLELAKLNLLKETPLVQVIDKPVLPLKKEKKGRLSGFLTWGFITFIFVLSFFYVMFLFAQRRSLQSESN